MSSMSARVFIKTPRIFACCDSRPARREAKYTGTILDGKGGARAALQLTGIIDRHDFHIDYTDPGDVTQSVGEDIRIHVWTEGIKTAETSHPATK